MSLRERYRIFTSELAPREYVLYYCITVSLGLGLGTALGHALGLQR